MDMRVKILTSLLVSTISPPYFSLFSGIQCRPCALLLTMVRWGAWMRRKSGNPTWWRATLLGSLLLARTFEKSLLFHLGLLNTAQHVFSWKFYFPLDFWYLLFSVPQGWWLITSPVVGFLSPVSLAWPGPGRDSSLHLIWTPCPFPVVRSDSTHLSDSMLTS